jgi:Tfp pilus assembly protein PilO
LPRASSQPFIKKLGTLEISMTVTGGYTNLKQFVRYLETNIRLANVTKLKFTPAGARGISDSLTLDVNVYYQQ